MGYSVQCLEMACSLQQCIPTNNLEGLALEFSPLLCLKLSFQLVVPVYKTKYPIKKGNSSPWKQKNLTIAQRCDLLIVCPVYSL